MAKLWVATLDDLTCDYCAEMDGMVIKEDEMWMADPGFVHPNCRCMELDLDLLVASLGLGWWALSFFKEDEDSKGAPPEGSYDDIPIWEYDPLYNGNVPDGVLLDGGTETNYSAYMVGG